VLELILSQKAASLQIHGDLEHRTFHDHLFNCLDKFMLLLLTWWVNALEIQYDNLSEFVLFRFFLFGLETLRLLFDEFI